MQNLYVENEQKKHIYSQKTGVKREVKMRVKKGS
jgi:hypothetical protein